LKGALQRFRRARQQDFGAALDLQRRFFEEPSQRVGKSVRVRRRPKRHDEQWLVRSVGDIEQDKQFLATVAGKRGVELPQDRVFARLGLAEELFEAADEGVDGQPGHVNPAHQERVVVHVGRDRLNGLGVALS
jgi:hypothetical protein